ncbi:MAG: DUF4160 domain-containing protein [Pyrinomonadaceae bacterium]
MPELCRFYGIVIRMYFADHPPPHFHAEYGEHEALIIIEDSQIFSGFAMRPKKRKLNRCDKRQL